MPSTRRLSRRAFIAGSLAATAMPSLPAPAREAGFKTVALWDDFDALDITFGDRGPSRWHAGLWYLPIPPRSAIRCADSVVTLTGDTAITTWCRDSSGGLSWRGGYFEARMRCTNWAAFWLFSVAHTAGTPVRREDPMTWTSEIDIVETDSGKPKAFICSVHKNSSSYGGVKDEVNHGQRNYYNATVPVLGHWHTYGARWTDRDVTWYFNGEEVLKVAPYPSTWQPMYLILSGAPGGVLGGRPVEPVEVEVDWVRVLV
jgi:hypothetical protein